MSLIDFLLSDDEWSTAQLKTEGKVVTIEAIQESGTTEPSYVAIDDVFFTEGNKCNVEPPEANVGQDCENMERCNDGGNITFKFECLKTNVTRMLQIGAAV